MSRPDSHHHNCHRYHQPHTIQPRSFGGCATCRARRVKCDEGQPTCGPCNKSSLLCGGYGKAIFFDIGDRTGNGRTGFRRPLFDEDARRAMSEQLSASVPGDLLQQLTQIDDACQTIATDEQVDICSGPFGVFRQHRQQNEHRQHRRHREDTAQPTREVSLCADATAFASRQDAQDHVQDVQDPHDLHEAAEPHDPQDDAQHDLEDVGQRPVAVLEHESMDTLIDSILGSASAGNTFFAHFGNLADFAQCLEDETALAADPSIGFTSHDMAHSGPESSAFAGLVTGINTHANTGALFDDDPPTMPHPSLLPPPTLPRTPQTPIPQGVTHGLSSSVMPSASLQDAVLLLRHFSTVILDFLSPIRHERTPWHTVFLPHTRHTLAQLMLGEVPNHACLCAFYAFLSISAQSLGGMHDVQVWHDQADIYRRRATQHAARMLRHAYDVPKKYKYKDDLMALQALALLHKLRGDAVHEEYYYLEAEKFIQLRGLGRKKISRKIRLLHHTYALERLFYESTCMRGMDPSYRHRVRHDIAASVSGGVVAYPACDTMAFRPPNWHNLDEEIAKASSPPGPQDDVSCDGSGGGGSGMDSASRDGSNHDDGASSTNNASSIHNRNHNNNNSKNNKNNKNNNHPDKDCEAATDAADDEALGLWPAPPYTKVSGLPEPWILLMLHIVLLGKDKDASEQQIPQTGPAGATSSRPSLDLREFHRRAHTLGQYVDLLEKEDCRGASASTTHNVANSAHRNVLDANRYALQIYFYRRIYDANPPWLQDRVVLVRDCLLRCEEACDNDDQSQLSASSIPFAGCFELLWASFIASCEAEDPLLQQSFAGWYRRVAQHTGMPCWANSLALSEMLWHEKRRATAVIQAGGLAGRISWIEILTRQRRLRLQAMTMA